MVNKNKIDFLRTAMGVLSIVVFSFGGLKAQTAENLFEHHHKWGITGQYNTFSAARVSPTGTPGLDYVIPKSRRFAVGAVYNFYQYKNWNLRAGLQLQWLGTEKTFFIAKEEIGSPKDFEKWWATYQDKVLYMPVTAEYVLHGTDSFSFALGGGLGLSYFWHFGENSVLNGGLSKGDKQIFDYFDSNKNQFLTSGRLEASVYFKRKSFMLQAGLVYKKSFASFRTGSYEFTNLEISPDVGGSIDQSGDFWGIALTAYLRNDARAGYRHKEEEAKPLPDGVGKKKTSFGLKGGLDHGYIIAENKDYYSGFELYGGFFTDTKLTDKLNLQNELLFSHGFDYYFIELPILLKYNIAEKWGVFMGPKPNYMFTDFPSVENSGFKNKKFGVSATVGVQYAIFKRLFGELRYAHGLTKQIDDPFLPLPNAKRHTLRIGIGYRF